MDTKVCRGCNASLSLDEFYRHPQMGDGRLNHCKTCVKNRIRKHRRENPHVAEGDHLRHLRRLEDPEFRKKRAERLVKWRDQNPEKEAAHAIVARAIAAGELQREPCEVCSDTPAHAHHDDYSKPLAVRWLCPLHHRRHHADEAA